MWQLRREARKGLCERQRRGSRHIAHSLLVLVPLHAEVDEPLATQRQSDVRRNLPITPVA